MADLALESTLSLKKKKRKTSEMLPFKSVTQPCLSYLHHLKKYREQIIEQSS